MIKILIVKQFAIFYSQLGFQFVPFTYKNANACIFLKNLIIFIVLFYTLYFNDPWNSSQMSLGIKQKRPLMAMFTKRLMKVVFPTLFHCKIIYFFLHGRKIINLLDHQLFWNIYKDFHATIPFYLIMILHTVTCFLSNPNMLFVYENSLSQNINLFTTVTLSLTDYVIYFILHYSQYGSLQILLKIKKNDQLSKRKVVSTVQSLSHLNKQINQLMSFPIMFHILICIIDIISIISSSLIVLNKFMFFNLYYIFENTLSSMYLFYIVHLNFQLTNTLSCISRKTFNLDIYKVIQFKYNNKTHISPQLDEIYQEIFKLRLFNLITLNYHNLLAIFLIILNYVIFMYQTY